MRAVLLVDDDAAVARTFARVVPDDFELHVASSRASALELLQARHSWDLFIVDLALERPDAGLLVLATIRERWRREPAVVLTGSHTSKIVNHAASFGAQLLLKPASRADLDGLFDRARTPGSGRGAFAISGLTPAQRRVVLAALDGEKNEAIASRLGLSRKTVESHVTKILRKTGDGSLRDLVARLGRIGRSADPGVALAVSALAVASTAENVWWLGETRAKPGRGVLPRAEGARAYASRIGPRRRARARAAIQPLRPAEPDRRVPRAPPTSQHGTGDARGRAHRPGGAPARVKPPRGRA